MNPSTLDQSSPIPPIQTEKPIEGWRDWFITNNPFYLISVLMMIIGLYLASAEASAGAMSLGMVIFYFGVQNVYEIVMVAMALYLLTAQIQPRHGKILLIFIMIFLTDLTFYQARISSLSSSAGFWVSSFYLLMAGIKLATIVKILGVTFRLERLYYPLAACALIWFSPQFLYNAIESTGRGTGPAGVPFNGFMEIYLIWLVAALIHLPLIVANWLQSDLDKPKAHPLLGDETGFWRWLLIFPFAVLPFQLIQNVMKDAGAAMGPHTIPWIPNLLPWLLLSAFFAQALWRQIITRDMGLNIFDSLLLLTLGFLALATENPHEVFTYPYLLNRTLLCLGLAVTWLTRKNLVNGGILGILLLGQMGGWLVTQCSAVLKFGTSISRGAWAALLMTGSFLLLGLGFLLSLSSRQNSVAPSAKPTATIPR